jgi:hypothetical protein
VDWSDRLLLKALDATIFSVTVWDVQSLGRIDIPFTIKETSCAKTYLGVAGEIDGTPIRHGSR